MGEYVIAKYIRLSIEDEKTESLSIPHQRMLLDRHINKLDIPNMTVLEFIDNGHSGTNMERPAVQEMLELVRSGRINLIAVKDFSRFSRNSMDSGYFLEQVFPLYQVRFISVSDGFDSNDYKNDTGGIDIAFKFLMHEYYSKDLSEKVRSAKRIKMLHGESIVKNAIYGYYKSEHGKWEPDTEAADIVREIFSLALNGLSTAQIRDKLCAARHPTPREYIEMKRGKDILPECLWTARMVLHILENEQYAGTYVSGKQKPKAIGSHSKVHTDRSEWIIIPDSHTPIVSKADFDAVQDILCRNKRSMTSKPLSSLLHTDIDRPRRGRMLSGERLPAKVIYGYRKDATGHLTPDESVAGSILEMFELAAQGVPIGEIRNRIAPDRSDKSIRSILQNIQYTGAYVSGKILKDYETGRKYHTAKEDWIVIPDKHPAIVSKELFDAVQKVLSVRQTKSPADYLLRSLVRCGCCGYAMAYDSRRRSPVFYCGHTSGDPAASCHKLKVDVSELDTAILDMIRKQAEVVLNTCNLSELRTIGADGKRISDYENEVRQCARQQQVLYEQFVLHEIDRDAYRSQKADCAERLNQLKQQIALLNQAERDRQAELKTADIAKRALSDAVTPREIVETLIDKVCVFSGDRLEVHWKIADFAMAEKL